MQKRNSLVKLTLLLASTLSVMAGATIAPSLTKMAGAFAHISNVEFLSKLLITLPPLFVALFSPLAGQIVDKVGRLKLLFASLTLYALAGATGFFINDLYWLLASRAILGISVAGVMTSVTTLISDYYQGEERQKILGFQGVFVALGGMLYVGLGGVLASSHWRNPFLIYMAALFILVLTIKALREPEKQKTTLQINQGNSEGKLNTGLFVFLMGIGFFGMLMFYMIPTQVPFLLKSIGLDKSSLSALAIVCATLAGAVGALTFKQLKNKLHYIQIYTLIFIFMGLGYGLLFWANGLSIVLLGMVLAGFGAGMQVPNLTLWVMELAPEHLKGRVIGGMSMAIFLGQFASPIVLYPFIRNFGIHKSYGFAGLLMLLIALKFLLFRFFKPVKAVGN